MCEETFNDHTQTEPEGNMHPSNAKMKGDVLK